MKHKDKRHLAFKIRTPDEASQRKGPDGTRLHEGLFTSNAWELRQIAIAKRVARNVSASRMRAEARKAAATPRVLPRWRQVLNARLEASRASRAARRTAYAVRHGATV